MGFIARARYYLSSKTLLILYYSVVYPYLTCCNAAWSSTYCSYLNCVYLLQQHIMRLIAKAYYLANRTNIKQFSLILYRGPTVRGIRFPFY